MKELEIRLGRIEDKIDRVSDRLSEQNSILAAQHAALEHHIKRTDLLEEQIKPNTRHVVMVTGVLKAVGLLATITGIAAATVKIIEFFTK